MTGHAEETLPSAYTSSAGRVLSDRGIEGTSSFDLERLRGTSGFAANVDPDPVPHSITIANPSLLCRSHARADERGQAAAGLPRQLRQPADPAEPVPVRDVLPAVEVRGPSPTGMTLATERHSYEKCQYEEFKKRVAKMNELREARDGARSN
ncbi:uncharacterized protein SPSK_09939 [Sporothrix schenckii 1099-18]|uniref:Uncharacterized protein n=1 Tax=Sporothrix schenckii 1099-18 TaxID=1397361 RepID=A0A0F2M5X9_SPOSC|nr:uncharacterized protein SPSK_09939 [Sporothrix schenckii 1099-18]KJR85103.1 hypothetical protein SPSK_09939 [Sporothrix schenckii 1099-18]